MQAFSLRDASIGCSNSVLILASGSEAASIL